MDTPSMQPVEQGIPSTKRKRSPSLEASAHPAPPAKAAKTHVNHLQINYLARQFSDDLPLVSSDDTLPSILSLIGDYDGVLQRHESMAGNLGARPLGPILIKRFERLFEGPPRVLKSHGKEGTSVTWLDVVEFARAKPEQFNLEKMRDGVRVCQFYTKQCRVEISEEDFVLIASGMPQKLIPPQPIMEDEEKELGTLEILEKNLGHVVQLADQVSARARQLNHRLKNRKNAIISRREVEAPSSSEAARPSPSSTSTFTDKGSLTFATNGERRNSQSPTSGFVAVNTRPATSNGSGHTYNGHNYSPSDNSRGNNTTGVNGTSLQGASPAVRAELLSKFFTTSERAQANEQEYPRKTSVPPSRPLAPPKTKSKPPSETVDYASILLNSASPVPIPNTPSTLVPYNKPSPAERFDDSGPYKAEMVARMEQLQRGDRILPPCDRCRRLHMDCLKNLTACMGCTKKHAKCSWKDVRDQELRDNPYIERSHADDGPEGTMGTDGDEDSPSAMITDDTQRRYTPSVADAHRGVRDEELLGEDASDDDGKDPTENHAGPTADPVLQYPPARNDAESQSLTPAVEEEASSTPAFAATPPQDLPADDEEKQHEPVSDRVDRDFRGAVLPQEVFDRVERELLATAAAPSGVDAMALQTVGGDAEQSSFR